MLEPGWGTENVFKPTSDFLDEIFRVESPTAMKKPMRLHRVSQASPPRTRKRDIVLKLLNLKKKKEESEKR